MNSHEKSYMGTGSLWRYNGKLEITIILLTLIVIILWYGYEPAHNAMGPVLQKIGKYFSEGRLSNLTAFFAITIGVYIAVISVLATSAIGFSSTLLEQKLDKALLFVTKIACWENVFAVLIGAFCPIKAPLWCMLYLGVLSVSVISFVKFLNIMFLVFQGNMQKMAEEIDRKTLDRNEVLLRLDNIEKDIKRIKDIGEGKCRHIEQ